MLRVYDGDDDGLGTVDLFTTRGTSAAYRVSKAKRPRRPDAWDIDIYTENTDQRRGKGGAKLFTNKPQQLTG